MTGLSALQMTSAVLPSDYTHQKHIQKAPSTTDLQCHDEGLGLGAPVPHEGLDELEDVHRLPLHVAVRRDDHGLLDGLAAPRQHVGDGHLPPEQTLRGREGGRGEREGPRGT